MRTSGTWLAILERTILARLNNCATHDLVQELGAEAVNLLLTTPKFTGEVEILQALLDTLQSSSEEGDRIEHLQLVLKSRIRNTLQKSIKIVIFTSFVYTCQELVRQLSMLFGNQEVATYQIDQSSDEVEENYNKFKNSSNCHILICDSSGEEGHNLQFADCIIHFDLPLSPNRIEQRNGRLNRIGQSRFIEFIVFAGADTSDSIQGTWYEVLRDGFKIFQESIASLQFFVDRKMPELETDLFQLGAYGLMQAIDLINEEIVKEKVYIDEQNVLDEIDVLEENSSQYFQVLDGYDSRHQEIKQAVEDWMCEILNFRVDQDENTPEIAYYKRKKPDKQYSGTLVSANELIHYFADHINQPGTYQRRKALKHAEAHLYRIGEGLIETLREYTYWDDRGKAFALWRHDETWSSVEGEEWIGFRFDYVIETNLNLVGDLLQRYRLYRANQPALKRRMDAIFPPTVETIFLDTQMNSVEEPELLNILKRPYSRDRKPAHDYSLSKNRLQIIDEFVSRDDWENLCRTSREQSATLLRNHPDFCDRCQHYATQAERQLGNRLEQLQLRLERQSQTDVDVSLVQEIEIERALKRVLVDGIRQPRLRLDSIGFYIVSGRSPSQYLVGEDDL
ncbi:MAG: SWF/SNF helicase family protein [Leptolyngbyaceae cyanobacterium RM2_2_4]|nr:SWF/SNF helicase family protein [Leptolyngbyaceae cyanobacterium RM2_2_4]